MTTRMRASSTTSRGYGRAMYGTRMCARSTTAGRNWGRTRADYEQFGSNTKPEEPPVKKTKPTVEFPQETLESMVKAETEMRQGTAFTDLVKWSSDSKANSEKLLTEWVQKVILKKNGFSDDEDTLAAYNQACEQLNKTT
eukprot:TRINITY_DN34258_c0_g1_i2.p1 TRINITY_DN34258_c0_g1~~TRINITY_DN34258_c0_g1_i2.p1  ORF type:complete len:140 (+),score=7.92 TRINITY_DN34258_c0_g1_i2:57-476(+)